MDQSGSERDAKAPNLFERAKEEVEAIMHKGKQVMTHDKETHGRSDDIDENTPVDKVKGPGVFERAKEELEALVEAIHPKKDARKDEGGFLESLGHRIDNNVPASGFQITRHGKIGIRSKRAWVPREDAALVEALSELSQNNYWKGDNGFRAGYLQALEKVVFEKIKDCTLKASPHIESRVKTLKKLTAAISEMRNHSSCFTWNEDEKMVVSEKTVFEEWVKKHPTDAGLRNKPFPHYDALCEIFGKDRTNGYGADVPGDGVEEIEKIEIRPLSTLPPLATISSDPVGCDSESSPPAPTVSFKATGLRKRKRAFDSLLVSIGRIAETMKEFVAVTKEHLKFSRDHMRRVAEEQGENSSRRRRIAFSELMKMGCFSRRQQYRASTLLGADESKIDMFLIMPEEREDYIRYLLEH